MTELDDERQRLVKDRRALERAIRGLSAALLVAERVLEELSGRQQTVFMDRSVWLGDGESAGSPGSTG